MPLRKPKGAARAARPLKDAGQTTVEYVVVIAIIIGLGAALTAFAATEKGSIADAANSVGNMFSQLSGPAGGGSGGGEGSGGSGNAGATGGSGAGAGSEIETLVQKNPQNWTLDDQKAVAEDIEKNGTASKLYEKAKAAMDADVNWSVELTNGKTMTYRIIGIAHDDLADGSGKAGLTFEATSEAFGEQCISSYDRGDGTSWGDAELRQRLNSGDLWSLLPNDLAGMTQTVSKLDYYPFGRETMDVNVFILSENEVYAGVDQYEYYSGKSVSQSNYAGASLGYDRWTRTPKPNNGSYHSRILSNGSRGNYQHDTSACYICPTWCF